jgi:hypothetical protein
MSLAGWELGGWRGKEERKECGYGGSRSKEGRERARERVRKKSKKGKGKEWRTQTVVRLKH